MTLITNEEDLNLASLDCKHDFGFTFAEDESDIKTDLEKQVVELKRKLKTLQSTFQPLLENLSKEPEKPMIRWPNRHVVIEEKLKLLKSLTDD